MKFELPALPYTPEALEPVISEKTISFHYGKHHQAYVNNLNNLVPGTRFENATLDQIVMEAEGGIFNNAAQVWNHTFYWESLGGDGTLKAGKLLDRINAHFGTFENFKEVFADSATKIFGSGWAWLVEDKEGVLKIVQTSNAGNPMRDGLKPLFTCDVWEHAYYIDFQNRRPDYIKAYLGIVNWKKVEERLG